MATVKLKDICKVYDNGYQAAKDVNIDIKDKEFIVLVGPSGCGKSTTLRMIAGLEDITSGELSIDGKVVNDVEPKDRDIAMVFQNYALYPHMTVYDNMSFALKLRKMDKKEIDKKVRETAKILQLETQLDKKPKALSGGQRQSISLLMSSLSEPDILLLDEHTAALDPKTSDEIIELTDKIVRDRKITTLMVTHNLKHAINYGDRIIMLHKGNIIMDVRGEEKKNLTAEIILKSFEYAV